MSVVIVVDIGSSSVRCSALGRGGEKGGHALQDVEGSMQQKEMDTLHLCADEIIEVVNDCVGQCLNSLPDDCEVADVALSCFTMNLVGVNAKGSAVTPLLSYAAAGSAIHEASTQLREEFKDKMHLVARTGTRFFHSSYAAPQILALSEEELEATEVFTTIPSLLLSKWADKCDLMYQISVSEASWTGMLSTETLDWEESVLDVLPDAIASKLPKVCSDHRDLCISKAIKKMWPQLGHANLHMGMADGAAANIGSMCTGMERVAVTVGTSAAARVLLSRKEITLQNGEDVPDWFHAGLWCYCLDEDRVLLGGALTDGGSIYAWAKSTLQWTDDIEEEALQLEPGSHGLDIVPHLKGERSPGWHEKSKMAIVGISPETKPCHILRASQEAVAITLSQVILEIIGAMGKSNVKNTKIVASGNALVKSKLLRQSLADLCQRPIYTSAYAENEATSRGAAILALSNSQGNSLEKLLDKGKLTKVATPTDGADSLYRSSQQAELSKTLVPFF
mmetsp:Transcript_23310/g.41219  ORF Transcript_23310/g.41219 Transcript_23310/m.41219 type:complete len:507 (+) Transcript_23310:33-1553(+)